MPSTPRRPAREAIRLGRRPRRRGVPILQGAPEAATLPAAQWLQLLWLASPALPVGGFSYSEVLEAAIDKGAVQGELALTQWLVDQLALAQGRADLPLAAAALRAWRRGDRAHLRELNDWMLLTRESSELRRQTEQMGRSMALWLQQQLPAGDADVAWLAALPGAPTWPVAWALAAARSGAPVREALLSHAFGWAENMVQAAIKAVPLGQSAGQRILQHLVQAMPAVVDAAIALPEGRRQALTPMLAILSAQHEQQYSRLFRS